MEPTPVATADAKAEAATTETATAELHVFPFTVRISKQKKGTGPYLRLKPLGIPVKWVDTTKALADTVAGIEQDELKILALDGEWPPHTSHGMSLLQLATTSTVYLIDVAAIGGRNTLRHLSPLLEDPQLLVAGMALPNDFRMLWLGANVPDLNDPHEQIEGHVASENVAVKSVLDLQELDCGGLAKLYKTLFDVHIDKSQQMSQWATRPLSKAQWEYAALDVVSVLQIVYAIGKLSEAFAAALTQMPQQMIQQHLEALTSSGSQKGKKEKTQKQKGKATIDLPSNTTLLNTTVEFGKSKLKHSTRASSEFLYSSLSRRIDAVLPETHWLRRHCHIQAGILGHLNAFPSYSSTLASTPNTLGKAPQAGADMDEEEKEEEKEAPSGTLQPARMNAATPGNGLDADAIDTIANHFALRFLRYAMRVVRNADKSEILLQEAWRLLCSHPDVFAPDSWVAFDLHLFSRCALSGQVSKDLPALFRSMYQYTFMWTNRSLGNYCHRVLKYAAIAYASSGLPPPTYAHAKDLLRADALDMLQEYYAGNKEAVGGSVIDLLAMKPSTEAADAEAAQEKDDGCSPRERAEEEYRKVVASLEAWATSLVRVPILREEAHDGDGDSRDGRGMDALLLPAEDAAVVQRIEDMLAALPQFHDALRGSIVAVHGVNSAAVAEVLQCQGCGAARATGTPPAPSFEAQLVNFCRVMSGASVLRAIDAIVTAGNQLPSHIAATLRDLGGQGRCLHGHVAMGPTCTLSTAVLLCIALLFHQVFPALGSRMGDMLGLRYHDILALCRKGWYRLGAQAGGFSLMAVARALTGHQVPSEQRNLFGVIREPGVRGLMKTWVSPLPDKKKKKKSHSDTPDEPEVKP